MQELFQTLEVVGLPCIWTGDMLDTKELIRGKCMNSLLSYFAQSKLQHVILVGNHDYFNLECEEHSLEPLKLLSNVHVIDEPTVLNDMVFVPYIHDQEKLRNVLREYANPNRVLFAHLELTDFDFGNGYLCTKGLSLADVSGYKRVVSGHFHKYQTKGNLTYIGTPFSHSFGEANQEKYLGMYDTETDELRLAETEFPKHVSIEFNCDLLNENNEHWIIPVDKPGWQRNHYRVILTGTQVNIYRFTRYMYDEVGTHGKLNIKWVTRPSDHMENQITIEDTVSNERQFTKWASEVRKMDDETIQLGLQIMEACK